MTAFNQNLRFLCKKIGLSQQKLADLLGEKRGRVAGYFYGTQSKVDFHDKLVDHFHIDLGRFLTHQMDEENFESFFLAGYQGSVLMEPKVEYSPDKNVIDLLLQAKRSDDSTERARLIDDAIRICGQLISENNHLKDKVLQSSPKKEG